MTALRMEHVSFIRKILKKIPVFSRLDKVEQSTLAARMELRDFKKNAKIVNKDEKMSWFGIIWKGKLVTTVSDEKKTMISGDYVGEEALVNDADHLAESTIKCALDSQILCISQKQFSKLFANRLSFNWRKSAEKKGDLDETSDAKSDTDDFPVVRRRREAKAETFTAVSVSQQQARAKASTMKTAVLSKWLKSQLSKNVLFKSLGPEILDVIVENLYCVEVAKAEVLMTQGEVGDCLYCIENGLIDVFIDGQKIPVTTMKAGDCVGELALMYDSKRAATCRSKTECKLWCIDRNDFKITLRRVAQKELQKLASFLKTVPVLQLLSDEERHKIAESLNTVHFKKDTVIIKEGEKCTDELKSHFYIIKSGKAAAFKAINGSEMNVKSYGSNEYFGERALITNEPRAATVKSVTDCVLLTLSRSEFVKTMGSIKMVIKNKMKNYEKAVSDLALKHGKKGGGRLARPTMNIGRMFRRSFTRDRDAEPSKPESAKSKRALKDYKFIHGIGAGSFATVWLVRDKFSKQTFALKRMSKRGIEDTQQQQHVANERDILSKIDCGFIIKMYTTFQDDTYVYMVLDLGLGGDMFTYLEGEGRLSEKKALFFMGCVVLAFEYLHRKQIVYRDLKPENLVLDFRGYLKLCDLGFAKKLNNSSGTERTYTVCGTPVYLAPEVIVGKGHSFPVDWWTSGIFLFELITGYPPFDESNLVNTYDSILHKAPKFKRKYFKSDAIVDLLKGLLNKKPNQRFGHSIIDIKTRIKQHAWFRTMDWDKLNRGEIPSPYRPRLKNDSDTRYFDQDIQERKYENCGKPKEPSAKWMQKF